MNRSNDTGARSVIPVSLLVSSARLLIERHLALAWIGGEISNFLRAASGHCYFQLKDDRAQVRCIMFRHKAQHLDFALGDGLQVEVRAAPTIYEARGDFQLNVETVRLAGRGALYEQFAKLKAKLEADGWFATGRKRALPQHPRAVGIITSRHAAALQDVLATLAQRMPALPVILYPTPVQGDGAAASIAAAIRIANARAEVEVLIICRGGGSIEDLWAFNEEPVARAVFESSIPVVSGVGHETDFTLCDFVADARAPTPTAAAALAASDRSALLRSIGGLLARWQRASERSLELQMQRLDFVSRRLIHPDARLRQRRAAIVELGRRLIGAARLEQERRAAQVGTRYRSMQRLLRTPLPRYAERLASLAQSLRHLNPGNVLERGYSIVTNEGGNIVQSSAQIAVGEALRLTFAQGAADATVTRRES